MRRCFCSSSPQLVAPAAFSCSSRTQVALAPRCSMPPSRHAVRLHTTTRPVSRQFPAKVGEVHTPAEGRDRLQRWYSQAARAGINGLLHPALRRPLELEPTLHLWSSCPRILLRAASGDQFPGTPPPLLPFPFMHTLSRSPPFSTKLRALHVSSSSEGGRCSAAILKRTRMQKDVHSNFHAPSQCHWQWLLPLWLAAQPTV